MLLKLRLTNPGTLHLEMTGRIILPNKPPRPCPTRSPKLACVPCPFAKNTLRSGPTSERIADTLRKYCIALSSKGQGALVPVDSMPPASSAEECHAVNPYFAWPPETSWGVTFTKQVLQWIGNLNGPCPGRATHNVGRTPHFISHAFEVAHPRNRYIYLTPGIHRTHAQGLRTLGTDIWSFKNALNTISSIVNQDLLPWTVQRSNAIMCWCLEPS